MPIEINTRQAGVCNGVTAMKCARLHLHERSKPRARGGRVVSQPDRPRRFCQKRMVNPAHEEDPRWTDLLDRFYCNPNGDAASTVVDTIQPQPDEDLFLSVQNITFDGNINERKRPKTCFKYKAMRDGKQHRMFVKQIVDEKEESAEECSSQLTCYYFDDYVKYILNSEQNVPSEKSSIMFRGHGSNNKEHKAVQPISKPTSDLKKFRLKSVEPQNNCIVKEMMAVKEEPPDLATQDTKIAYHKSGKRKCLTISRAQSPETVQVIRVDVVRHARGAGADSPASEGSLTTQPDDPNKLFNNINMKTSHFSNKYLLTNTTKTLDENVSGGAKVTLLCKTFRLSSRTKSKNEKSCIKNNWNKS